MKFLVIGTFIKPWPSYPQATLQKMWEDTFKGLEKNKKAGIMQSMYYMPGWEKVVSIEEYKSADAIMEVFTLHPWGDSIKWEVYPLADFNDETVKIMAKKFNLKV
jgi:hypothetical protein